MFCVYYHRVNYKYVKNIYLVIIIFITYGHLYFGKIMSLGDKTHNRIYFGIKIGHTHGIDSLKRRKKRNKGKHRERNRKKLEKYLGLFEQ